MADGPLEQAKAELSATRGKNIAAEIKSGNLTDPIKIQKEISAQGDLEAKNKLTRDAAAKLASRGTQSFHKGGKIEKDGEQIIKAEKGETVLPNHGVDRAAELAMDHMKGMKDGMEAGKKKSSKSEHEVPKHRGKLHKMHHTRNTDGTWHIEHEYHPNEDGSSNPNTTHSAMDGDGLVSHVIEHGMEPNEGEPQADGGQHGVPDEHAGPAGLPLQGA